VFLVLFGMHLLDSAERWLMTGGVLDQVRADFRLSSAQAGWLSTVLLVGFTALAPPIGYLADRVRRPRLLAVGFALSSLATVGSGLATSYDQLQVARALVGIGEAAFMATAIALLSDLFPRRLRGRTLAGFFLALPLGATLGMSLGAAFASWQTAFLAAGAPGLLLALLALALPDPVRGWSDGVDIPRLRLHEQVGPSREDYIDLMVNSSYTYSVFGLAFSSFALAGLVYWLPTYLTAARGLPVAFAGLPLGATLLAAAIAGIGGGGWLADYLVIRQPRSLFILPGLAMFAAIGFVLAALYGRGIPWTLGAIFLAVALMFQSIGPCYAIIAAVVMPNMRAAACAVALSATHLLGDLWSPTLMDWVIDTFGQPDSMATVFGQFLTAIGAVPVIQPGRDPENLTAGMLSALPALVISGAVLLAASRHLPREMALMLAKLRALPARRPAANP
jgi:predicted MFS family arabinose efflux permease